MTNGGNVVLTIHGIILPHAAVAQLDRVLGYEPRGRGFESCQPRHIPIICPPRANSSKPK